MYIGLPLYTKWGNDYHITITFNGRDETKNEYHNAVRALANTCSWWYNNSNGLIALTYGAIGCFSENIWHATVKSAKLVRFRNRLTEELDALGVWHSEDFEYTPHVTLNYGAKPEFNPFERNFELFDKVAVESRAFGTTMITL